MRTRALVPRRQRLSSALLAIALCCWLVPLARAQTDPLPSWNDGAVKQAITAFVARVTKAGGADFVAPAERIATFDNDGTLWAEQPAYFQFAFAIDRVKTLAPQNPEWRDTQPFKAVLEGDHAALAASGEHGLLQIVAASHFGTTTEAFAAVVQEWLATARHPRFNRPYTEIVYQPQLELLAWLRASGFKTFIVSGGGVEFLRVFAERVYGIPPEQVVGSTGVVKYVVGPDGKAALFKEAKVDFIDDGPGKPVGIHRFIGRRPILAFGNSDGDLQMLQYTVAGPGPRLAALLHHTDGTREWAYDRASKIGRLDKALDEATTHGWTVVNMQRDWKRVFAFEK